MRNYKIITDSTCDLPGPLARELGIHIIPMTFVVDGESHLHDPLNHEFSPSSFYEILAQGKSSTTSMINMAVFREHFTQYLNQGLDLLYLSFSSQLSGSCNAARLAMEELKEEYPDRKLILVDTRAASIGQGLLVKTAAEKQREGFSLEDLTDWVTTHRDKVCHWFTVEDLQHLKRGGRIGAVTANVGTALNIKPVLRVDHAGALITHSRVMGRKKSLLELIERMKKDAENPKGQKIIIGHGNALKDAEFVASKVREEIGVEDILITPIGPVIGSHTGPGIIGLVFMGLKDETERLS